MPWYFYIASNANHTLYAGISSNLIKRLHEHKTRVYTNAFTARYNFDRILYFEILRTQNEAAKRERQVKGWTRARKIALIEVSNPEWRISLARIGVRFWC
jgi:putative endonuclease